MPSRKPRSKRAKAPESATVELLALPRSPALVTRAAFGAALLLLGCERSPPPMPAPPMNPVGPNGPTPTMTAISEESGEAANRPDAGLPDAQPDTASVTDAGDSGAKPAPTGAKIKAPPVETAKLSPPMARPPMVRPPPPMINRPPMQPPPMSPPPHPAPPDPGNRGGF